VWRITLKGVVAHKFRFLLTAVAVLLGVTFMAGTMVFTDTISHTFNGLYSSIYRHTAAVVRARQAYATSSGTERRRIDASVADTVRGLPGVAGVRLTIEGYAQLVGKDGKPLGNPGAGPPALGEAWTDSAELNPFRLLPGGQPPRTSSEIVIDKHSADLGHFRVGDEAVVLTKAAPQTFTIVGIVTFGSADSPLGAGITVFEPATAARLLGEPGKVDQIDVSAAPGATQADLARRIDTALHDPSLEVLTGHQVTKESESSIHKDLSFLNTFLLVFAVIALFVGSFIIFNTFSIVVAQRMRELALLRAVGATRAQVTLSVLGESLVLGVVASAGGVAAGVVLAAPLKAGMAALGIDIPAAGLVVGPRTIVVSMLVGVAVTLAAAVLPARRAGRVLPVAAMREVAVEPTGHSVLRVAVGCLVTLVGAALLSVGLFAHVAHRLTYVGAGAATVFLGVAALGPVLTRPLSRVIGTAITSVRGTTGELATENVARNPRRSSSTAAALMIGVALVALIAVIAASTKASVGDIIDRAIRADFVVTSGTGNPTALGLSPEVQRRIAALPEVSAAMGVRVGPARINGANVYVGAGDPARTSRLIDFGVSQGRLEAMGVDGIAVSERVAADHRLALGQPLTVVFPTTGARTFTIGAIYRAREVTGDYLISLASAEQNFRQQLDFQVYVKLADGVSPHAGRAAIGKVLADYPTAKLQDQTQYKHQQAAQIDQLVNLLYGLLALAIIIALIGIANTLALSIHERVHELGLLRAVGMTRGQLRAAVRYEALIIAILGTVMGLVIGILFGWALVVALSSQGIRRLVIPGLQLLIVAVVAALAGIVAAVGPGRRAARLDVLRAIASE